MRSSSKRALSMPLPLSSQIPKRRMSFSKSSFRDSEAMSISRSTLMEGRVDIAK